MLKKHVTKAGHPQTPRGERAVETRRVLFPNVEWAKIAETAEHGMRSWCRARGFEGAVIDNLILQGYKSMQSLVSLANDAPYLIELKLATEEAGDVDVSLG